MNGLMTQLYSLELFIYIMASVSQQYLFGRSIVLQLYESFLQNNTTIRNQIKSIAVVSGTPYEPELEIFSHIKGVEIHYYGIGEQDIFLNLNHPSKRKVQTYDLVLCNQVLEHIWHLENAIDSLVSLLNHRGILFLSMPASNKKHGNLNDYFSAGYQPQLFRNMLEERQLEVLLSQDLGSERLYNMTHRQQIWPTITEHNKPLVGMFRGGIMLHPVAFLKYLVRAFEAYTWSPKIVFGSRFSTETFLFARKGQGRK